MSSSVEPGLGDTIACTFIQCVDSRGWPLRHSRHYPKYLSREEFISYLGEYASISIFE